jgi:hypothetical protein
MKVLIVVGAVRSTVYVLDAALGYGTTPGTLLDIAQQYVNVGSNKK